MSCFNPSKESTAALTKMKSKFGMKEIGFNPSKESTAALTELAVVGSFMDAMFQPLKGINGRSDVDIEVLRLGRQLVSTPQRNQRPL